MRSIKSLTAKSLTTTSPTVSPTASPAVALGAYLLILGLAGCGGGESVAPFEQVADPKQQYLQLVLNHHAINLSTVASHNTVQLTATPLDATGAPMVDLAAPTFRSTDTNKVKVTPDGLVTGVQVTAASGVAVIAELAGPYNVRRTDTAFVNVVATTDPPPVLATLSIDPVPPDSAILPMFGSTLDFAVSSWFLNPSATQSSVASRKVALTAAGDTIKNLLAEYTSLDPAVATVDLWTGAIKRLSAGTARLVARTFAYGVSKEATAEFTITPPYGQTVLVRAWAKPLSIFGPTIYLRPNGVVIWYNRLQPVDVVFDDPAAATLPTTAQCIAIESGSLFGRAPGACGTGNFSLSTVNAISSASVQARWFASPGTYDYHDALTGAAGRIVVTDGVIP